MKHSLASVFHRRTENRYDHIWKSQIIEGSRRLAAVGKTFAVDPCSGTQGSAVILRAEYAIQLLAKTCHRPSHRFYSIQFQWWRGTHTDLWYTTNVYGTIHVFTNPFSHFRLWKLFRLTDLYCTRYINRQHLWNIVSKPEKYTASIKHLLAYGTMKNVDIRSGTRTYQYCSFYMLLVEYVTTFLVYT